MLILMTLFFLTVSLLKGSLKNFKGDSNMENEVQVFNGLKIKEENGQVVQIQG